MPASVSLTTCRSIDDMQKHIGVLLLRPLRSVALGVGIGRDVKRVEPHDAIDMSADVFRKGGIGLVQNILPVEQRPHLADGLVADPSYDAADLVEDRLDRLAFGVPVGARARQLEGDRADLVGLAAGSSTPPQTGGRAACHRCAPGHRRGAGTSDAR
jgi:hypothetical protein